MKTLLNVIKVLSISSMIFWFSACGESKTNNEDKDKTKTEDIVEITSDNLTTYLIPSPKDMFAFTNNSELKFSANVLNNKENVDKYLDTKSLEVGFGVYSADLAYTAAFNQTGTAGEYLKVVESLSDKIGLNSVFTESLISRFKKINNKDSLLRVTNDTYYDIVKFLEENERTSSLSLISVGGWVESLFIVTSLQNEYDENNKIVQLIADQKNIFENLILSLEQKKEDKNISEILNDLTPIKNIYDKLEVVKVEKPKSTPAMKNKIVIGGTTKITITKEQFESLKEAISNVRNKFTGNN